MGAIELTLLVLSTGLLAAMWAVLLGLAQTRRATIWNGAEDGAASTRASSLP